MHRLRAGTTSHLLLAVGRTPNAHDLGLEQAGIEVDERGLIRVYDQLRTNVAGVWAIGEVNGRGAFTHTAYNDFEIVAANLFDDDPRQVTDRIPCYGLFKIANTQAGARAPAAGPAIRPGCIKHGAKRNR